MSDLFSGIASLTKSVSDTLNSYEVRKISDKVQSYVMNFTEPEIKVRDATTEEPWGPTPDMMREIAGLTFQYDAFPEVMGMLWKRMLPPSPVAWRRTYKSLILLEHLLKNGCERVISNARDHVFEMRSLEHYKSVNERGKDEGINVRYRAKAVLELLEDDDKLREERKKAKVAGKEDKYRGFSRDEMTMRGFSGSSSSSSTRNNRQYEDSYDNDSRYDRDSRFDEDRPSGKREVTAFDFGGGTRRDASPELGIRADSPVNNDPDDEFGDFASARTSAGGNKPAAKRASDGFADFTDFTSALPSPPQANGSTAQIPSVPPPPGGAPKVGAVQNDFFFSSPATAAPAKTTSNDFDFLNLNTAPVSSGPVIQPPSGPPSPAVGTKSSAFDDLFVSNPTPAKPVSNDPLDIFSPVAKPAPAAADPFFDVFGGSSSSTPQPLSTQTSFTPSNFGTPQPLGAAPADDIFSSFSLNQPATSHFPTATPSAKPAVPSATTTTTSPANKSALWNDLSNSLDLDNLLSTKPKQNVSMNEMKNRQP
uniref:ENTH domain-containing protein n=1 Tax=Panagrellus redivivus TaxID=6233 RepID=A0A7E4W167_PANRE